MNILQIIEKIKGQVEGSNSEMRKKGDVFKDRYVAELHGTIFSTAADCLGEIQEDKGSLGEQIKTLAGYNLQCSMRAVLWFVELEIKDPEAFKKTKESLVEILNFLSEGAESIKKEMGPEAEAFSREFLSKFSKKTEEKS